MRRNTSDWRQTPAAPGDVMQNFSHELNWAGRTTVTILARNQKQVVKAD